MAKIYERCKLCGAMKFLNFIGLCKRCNQSPEALPIINAAVLARQERLAHEAEDAKKEEAAAAQAAAKAAAEAPEGEAEGEAPKEGEAKADDAKKEEKK